MRLILALALLGGVLRAQSPEQHVESVVAVIAQGGIAAIHDRMAVGAIAGNPEWARRVCAAAATCDLAAALLAKDDLKSAAEKIREIGATAAENNAESADAWTAAADGAYFHLRALNACGEETATQQWLDVAEALVKAHGLKAEEGAPLERAVKWLREGQGAKGVEVSDLKRREDELCQEGAKLYPQRGLFAGVRENSELEEILALLGADKAKEARPRLAALLGRVKDDTLYNDAVTVAKEHSRKLGIKAEYVTNARKYFDVMEYLVPRGDRWKTEKDAITQYGRDGKLVRRLTLDWFERNTLYTLGDTEYDGSNEKGMALITERDVLSVIVKIERRSPIIKKALNREITGVQYFDIAGFDKDGDFTRFHTYLWKSDERPWLTYRLWIIELQKLEGLDPAARFVVDSLRETKYEGKGK
jgi:hypothetical protein